MTTTLAKDLSTWVGTFARGMRVHVIESEGTDHHIVLSNIGGRRHTEWVPAAYLTAVPA